MLTLLDIKLLAALTYISKDKYSGISLKEASTKEKLRIEDFVFCGCDMNEINVWKAMLIVNEVFQIFLVFYIKFV